MSTVELANEGPSALHAPRGRVAAEGSRTSAWLGAGLFLAIAYAAFAHGAVTSPTEPRLQVAVVALAAFAGAALIWSGTLRFRAPRLAYAGIVALLVFAVWSGLSIAWSAAPDRSWLEFNRVLCYVIVVCLAVAFGASAAEPIEATARGFLVIAGAVTCYALGQKLLPGLRAPGLFNLNQTGQVPRLQQPLGYWNALALFLAISAPIALAFCADRTRSPRLRLASAVALQLMLLVIGLTYSRGGVLALAVGVAIGIALSAARLRSLLWLALSVVAALPPLIFGLTDTALTSSDVSLGRREVAGILLAVILALAVAALVFAGRRVLDLERTVYVDSDDARRIAHRLLALSALVIVAGLLAATFSSRGLPGTVSHTWKSFTATRGISESDPRRLLSADSQNRWVWWKEALGGFSAKPVAGWGAGSFPVVHLLYRRDKLTVEQPHSVPLQLLVETGVIGALLALGAYGLLLTAGIRTVRQHEPGRERLLRAALVAGAVAYAAHALYDWDWDIPGVTLPALVFLGVLAGSSVRERRDRLLPGPGLGARAVGVGLLAICLCTVGLSATLPSVASTKASAALVAASGGGGLQHAQQDASLARRLDPLSDEGPRAEATIALHRLQPARARVYLLDAVRRDPNDVQAWIGLSYAELATTDPQGALFAAKRALALDPRGALTQRLVRSLQQPEELRLTPPNQSATSSPLGP
jgi:O-Antigen ligase